MKIANYWKKDKLINMKILSIFNEDKNPSLAFFVIEYTQNIFDLISSLN
ncbi:hypothetical protein MM26B8_02330 [Mycoplasmopsis meleagridis]|nr:hypothetical protein [Mycoplasmopsis meleagridis]OAD18396.1 hypothetical protein MM26B8_02330 [Mycoplasmopsis meleagridis]